MDIFIALSKPPKMALKTIIGGRLKGMTDINPQWRYRALTDVFGLCGVGWKYTIDKTWREDATAGEVFCFAQVSLYVKTNNVWSEAIQGTGGSKLISKERDYLYNNDEGYKMAITDALSVASKMIGVGSEIYEGNFDGSKYKKNIENIDQQKTTSLEHSKEKPKEFFFDDKDDKKEKIEVNDSNFSNIYHNFKKSLLSISNIDAATLEKYSKEIPNNKLLKDDEIKSLLSIINNK